MSRGLGDVCKRQGYTSFRDGLHMGMRSGWADGPSLDFQLDQGSWDFSKDKEILISVDGIMFFSGLIAPYQEEIDALDAEYRAKGLRV